MLPLTVTPCNSRNSIICLLKDQHILKFLMTIKAKIRSNRKQSVYYDTCQDLIHSEVDFVALQVSMTK
jgi:hypothetical protein